MNEFTKGYKYALGGLTAIVSSYLLLWLLFLGLGVVIAALTDRVTFMAYWSLIGHLMGVPL